MEIESKMNNEEWFKRKEKQRFWKVPKIPDSLRSRGGLVVSVGVNGSLCAGVKRTADRLIESVKISSKPWIWMCHIVTTKNQQKEADNILFWFVEKQVETENNTRFSMYSNMEKDHLFTF